MQDRTCFLCRKHLGLEAAPPGGYIFEDLTWMVCHAPVNKGPLGTLFIESRRHFENFDDFTQKEAESFGAISRQLHRILRSHFNIERIYQLSMMEGVPHFHVWLIPRYVGVSERGVAFLARDSVCTEAEVATLVEALRRDVG